MRANKTEQFNSKQETYLKKITGMMSKLSQREQERIYYTFKGFELANTHEKINKTT